MIITKLETLRFLKEIEVQFKIKGKDKYLEEIRNTWFTEKDEIETDISDFFVFIIELLKHLSEVGKVRVVCPFCEFRIEEEELPKPIMEEENIQKSVDTDKNGQFYFKEIKHKTLYYVCPNCGEEFYVEKVEDA